MATLNQEEVSALEQLRQRLRQLYTSLNSLQSKIGQSESLPPWYVCLDLYVPKLFSRMAMHLSDISQVISTVIILHHFQRVARRVSTVS